MPKEIKLCLVYRDMWQSSGKYMPDANQLVKVAEPIINMDLISFRLGILFDWFH